MCLVIYLFIYPFICLFAYLFICLFGGLLTCEIFIKFLVCQSCYFMNTQRSVPIGLLQQLVT